MPTQQAASGPTRRDFLARMAQAGLLVALPRQVLAAQGSASSLPDILVAFPGPWQFQIPKGAIILVSDQQLDDLTDPDREVDLSLSATPNRTTLRRVCEQTRASGARTLIIAFDEFWSQYRAGQGGVPRQWTPDTEGYLSRIARISGTVRAHGLGLELSLLSPLELGLGFRQETGETGAWSHYREGWRDPATGRYTVALWEQRQWTNNKGMIPLERMGVRAFAFRERRVGRTAYFSVDPAEIVELTRAPELVSGGSTDPRSHQGRLEIRGHGDTDIGPLDRVLVVVSYRTPELDYFSPRALPFLENLISRYHAAGVPLHGLYADEIHIQGDWRYADHHDEGQFALRYVTDSMAREFAALHGAEFGDFAKYLVYFCVGQHSFLPGLAARVPAQHVFGPTPEAIHQTFLLRRRYYDLLERTVVDLFVRAKGTAERLYGHPLEARAHATWAQSPTIDFWETGESALPPRQYEYTADFAWSNTVHQAASACSDYFRWNDFLTGGGNDHAEGGWSDRNYYGLALACSTGILNRVPNAYAAAWGMPAAALERRRALENAFGCAPDPAFAAIQDFAHRDVPVLLVYPQSLVAWDERFGSWMVQYGYANYVTAEKLLQRGRLSGDGRVELAGRSFGTVVVLFEPLPPPGWLEFLAKMVGQGGRVIWSGPPPRFDLAGAPVLDAWQQVFGVARLEFEREGRIAAGGRVDFRGTLAPVPPQTVLTDFLVDRVYPVRPSDGVESVAHVSGMVVGVARSTGRGGSVFLGFRPRDDQSASLGYEVKTLYSILRVLGAYSGRDPGVGDTDDPSVVSRESPFLATSFPNGTVCLAPHYRHHIESWPGGFHRDAAQDESILRTNPVPPDTLDIRDLRVAGHTIQSYRGRRLVAFRLEAGGTGAQLVAFGGYDCERITVDGREHVVGDRPCGFVAWAPVHASRRVPGGAVQEVWVQGDCEARIPLPNGVIAARLLRAGSRPGSVGEPWPTAVGDSSLRVRIGPADGVGHFYVVPG